MFNRTNVTKISFALQFTVFCAFIAETAGKFVEFSSPTTRTNFKIDWDGQKRLHDAQFFTPVENAIKQGACGVDSKPIDRHERFHQTWKLIYENKPQGMGFRLYQDRASPLNTMLVNCVIQLLNDTLKENQQLYSDVMREQPDQNKIFVVITTILLVAFMARMMFTPRSNDAVRQNNHSYR